MFGEIFFFELKSNFKRPATYIYFGILFMLTLLIGLAAADVFNTTRSDSNMLINSPYMVSGVLLGSSSNIFGILVSVLLISIMAGSIQKDYQYNCHPLFFTKPITKSGYFFGRFTATAFVAVFVFSSLLLGYFTGTLFGIGKPMMGSLNLQNYIEPFLIFTIPNILLLGVLFFSLTTFLRTTMAAYIIAIILMVLQIVSSNITQDIDYKMLAAILEPTGSSALGLVTEYWSPYEKNLNSIPLEGALLYNRLLWSGVAVIICLLSYWRFSFTQFLEPLRLFKSKPPLLPYYLRWLTYPL
jgi:ABC-2 type transport system permease protein